MLLCGAESLRDVIAFPKTQKGTDLMTDAPTAVVDAQLDELHIAPQGMTATRRPTSAARSDARAARRRKTFDLLVIGGGVTGAGIARDAALRGLKVALVEKTDFAAGSRRESSKLVHGGLRYLQYGELALVFEGLSRAARAS